MLETNSLKPIIISAFVTGIITVLSTLTINYLSTNKNKLYYTTQTSIPFQNDSLNVRIYNLELINDGDDVIENIKGVIQFEGQEITDYKVKNSLTLTVRESLSDNKFQISIASLNPSEKLTISFLISNLGETDNLPIIDFRAKGLSAKAKTDSERESTETPFNKLLLGITTGVFLSTLLLSFSKNKIRRLVNNRVDDDELHSDDQHKIIAYLCGIHGLTHEIYRYLDKKNDVAYWSEADYFGNISLINRGDQDNPKRLKVLLDLIKYASVAKESKGILYYNIAKIYKALDDNAKSTEYLNMAKIIIPKRISQRLLIDTTFT